MDTGAYALRRSDLIVRVVGGETVVLDPRKRLIHKLNATAGLIWELCQGPVDVSTIASRLADTYSAVDLDLAVRDVAATLARFEELGLLERTPPTPAGDAPTFLPSP